MGRWGVLVLKQPSRRSWWPFVLFGVVAVACLAAAGVWVAGVFMMSDPGPRPVGVRIDGALITVKAPVCPDESVEKVEVFDNEAERLLWQASAPRAEAGRRGEVRLWEAAAFLKPGLGAQPRNLPEELAVSFTLAGASGGPEVAFSLSEVTMARLSEGHFWTADGPMSPEEIDSRSCVE